MSKLSIMALLEAIKNMLQSGLNNCYIPTVLFTNASGTKGTITLSDSAANYEYLEIEFRSDLGLATYRTERFYNPNGKYISFTHHGTTTDGKYLQMANTSWQVNGNKLTYKEEEFINAQRTSATFNFNAASSASAGHNAISKVIGWKKIGSRNLR